MQDGQYDNISLLGVAAAGSDPALVQLLLDLGCQVNYNETGSLYYREQQQSGQQAGQEYSKGVTPLHVACVEGSQEVVSTLLAAPGVKVDQQDQLGNSPLYDAASWGRANVVKLLVGAGADPSLSARCSRLGDLK